MQVQGEDSEAALVTFENDEGVSTALLLSNSLLDDRVRPHYVMIEYTYENYGIIYKYKNCRVSYNKHQHT